MLHRNVSTDSILILDEDPEDPPDPLTVKGLLADWDLAITKEELENPAFTAKTRCVRRIQASSTSYPHR